ncbi:DNA/RNA non-specific endonuclease [Aquimarina sp. ERC-38]|uniref:DNA/RNA non-specific endonuclease n=1 Tax=Aquimarina sp. ERC-38 TaxID=2949996 RepID=UPI0022450D85|nr:DNA/RNA non-specific endonuclease [Aquimarina sp. ERC-38]UZO80101.1 DNA/RNA non-specific endonuclease [Aquimarina sp. ERC-38]
MQNISIKNVALATIIILFINSCTTEDNISEIENQSLAIFGTLEAPTYLYDNQGPHEHNHSNKRASGFTEGFENTDKPSYANGTIFLQNGNWFASDALVGDLSNDRKFGRQSVRIRNTGYVVMSFDMDNGARSVSVRHAKYGSDGTSTWRLIASYDRGDNWSFVGNTVTTSSTRLNTVSFSVNDTRRVRYGIYKTGGGSSRINIDNIEINTGGSTGGRAQRDSNLTFGNPSNAGNFSNNYFLLRPEYTLSYNEDRGTANWVSWHLSKAWRGSASRCNCFEEDRSLPSSFFRVSSSDYSGSGFDRGHICPSADRTFSSGGNANTFFMTNMAPQAPDNNQKSWADFENYLRSLLDDNEIHIISGVAGSGGTGREGFRRTIANGAVSVPDSFWKVALIIPNGTNDINRVTTSSRVLAINVPNDQNISTNWRNFRTSIDAIERLTGYDFYENLPNQVEAVLEARVGN